MHLHHVGLRPQQRQPGQASAEDGQQHVGAQQKPRLLEDWQLLERQAPWCHEPQGLLERVHVAHEALAARLAIEQRVRGDQMLLWLLYEDFSELFSLKFKIVS